MSSSLLPGIVANEQVGEGIGQGDNGPNMDVENNGSFNPFLQNSNEPKSLKIAMGHQWLIQLERQELVGQDVKLYVTIESGIAEILGTELANNVEYCFQNWNFSLFAIEDIELTWKLNYSNAIEDLAAPQNIIVNDTAKYIYNLHFALEKIRNSSFDGPRILILGDSNTGKTSLARILSSYTIKFKSYQPLFVNLDPNQPIVSPPGCLMATPISDLIDLELSNWNQSLTSGATKLHGRQPIIKNFGLENINDNKEWYKQKVQQLSDPVQKRIVNDSLIQRSGCIIDTPSIFMNKENENENDDILKLIIDKLNVNVVIVLAKDDDDNNNNNQHETINKRLSQFLNPNTSSVVIIPPLCGVIPNTDVYKRSLQRNSIRDYFYGNSRTVLSPYVTSCDFEDLTIWRPQTILDSTITGSETVSASPMIAVPIDQSSLQHAVVAITFTPRRAPMEEVMESAVMGFGLITEVNEKRRKVKVLLPVPGTMPSNALILTSYRYLE